MRKLFALYILNYVQRSLSKLGFINRPG